MIYISIKQSIKNDSWNVYEVSVRHNIIDPKNKNKKVHFFKKTHGKKKNVMHFCSDCSIFTSKTIEIRFI